jgi:transketolase
VWIPLNDPIMADMRSEYSKSLIQLGHDNPNVVVLGADTTDSLNISGFGKQLMSVLLKQIL